MHRASTASARCALLLVATLLLGTQTGCSTLAAAIAPSPEALAQHRSDELRAEMIERQRGRKAALDAPSQLDALSAEDHLRTGDRHRERGEISKAAMAYLRAQWAEGGETDGATRLAFLALRKEPQKSLELFQQLVTDSPEDPLLRIGMAVAQLERGDLPRARNALRDALVVATEPATASQVHELLGVVHDRLGEHEQAQIHYLDALEARPGDTRLLNNLGVSYLLERRYADAATRFEQALASGADDPAIRNNLGLAYGLSSRYSEAMREFRAVGTHGDALNNMGYLLFLQGRHDKALDFFAKALLSNDTNERRVLENIALLEQARAPGR